jgi:hypothetical protein
VHDAEQPVLYDPKFQRTPFREWLSGLAIDPNGRIIAAGGYGKVIRLNADGTLGPFIQRVVQEQERFRNHCGHQSIAGRQNFVGRYLRYTRDSSTDAPHGYR